MTTGIKNYSTTPASNNSPVPNGFPEGMAPAGVNDSARKVMADIREWYIDPVWIDLGNTPVYVSGTSFTIVGDVTTSYLVNTRIRAVGTTPFTIYGRITSSTYSAPNTTIIVSWDSGTLDATLSEIAINKFTESTAGMLVNRADSISTSNITNNAITNDKMADNSVGTAELIDANVTRAKLAQGAVARVSVSASQTGAYTALVTDDVIRCDATSAGFTVTLYAASGNAGRRLVIKKTDSTFNIVTIDANASETIDGALTRRLCTQNEELTLVCDGTNWIIENRIIPSIWTTYTPTLTHNSGGITNNTNSFRYRRVGDSIQIMGGILFSAASAAFSALFFTVPSGLTIDSAKMTTSANLAQSVGNTRFVDSGVNSSAGDISYVFSSGVLQISVFNAAGTYAITNDISNTVPITFGNLDSIHATTFSIPITNWEG